MVQSFCPKPFITRLAPSPTGYLHVGNAWSFLLAWLAARTSGGKALLRMDDIDPQRSKPQYADAILEDLAWLGLDFDGEIIWQSDRTSLYGEALKKLHAKGLIYPCFCTRKELRSLASAPHLGDAGAPYAGTCAQLTLAEQQKLLGMGKGHALRLRTPEMPVVFDDIIQGKQVFARTAYGGDFALRRSDGVWAYQLASIVDDLATGVNLILRGRDLLASTPRQILIAGALGHNPPSFAHIPLLHDKNGERLAKRHQSLSLRSLRQQGIRPERIIALLGRLAMPNLNAKFIKAIELTELFQLRNIPPDDQPCPL